MQEYAQKPKKTSSDSNSRSSGQPPISEILQAYKNGTLQRMSVDEEELLQAKTRDKSSERETLQLYTDYTHRDKSRYNSFIQGMFDTPQRKGVGNEEPLQGKFDSSSAASESTVQRGVKPNNTGLPDNLKSGIENLSGYSMDDVKVHYNSDKPAQLSALAYAQGTDIHVAPGQERHLPHEAWHVVQQKQGRVQPTMQMQGVDVNDNEGLEREADVMGGNSFASSKSIYNQGIDSKEMHVAQLKVIQRVIIGEIEVNNDTNMPSWSQDGVDYHINLTSATSHVTASKEGMPKVHYFFEGAGVDIVDKQPEEGERGRAVKVKIKKGQAIKVKTSTVFSKLPLSVQNFIKNNWDTIFDG